ncbi:MULTISPECIES: hypothetical protein [unclassified Streptomyces]|uniref:hypothetical protein n=1 Tax=unclassified Streptomyces TaxID=2593676 RepID=UPI00131A426F|nr:MULTISPECIES: hypothetical protein [unclassified Streptomyces]MYX31270.1 hypothetical protein [Streptomyces sp. SID8381]
MDPVTQMVIGEKFLPFWEQVTWSAIENAVLGSELDIDDLTDEEVVIAALALHLNYPGTSGASEESDTPGKTQWSTNHETELRKQGDIFLGAEKFDFAILFYATWIEHWLNRIILLRSIGMGTHVELATALIRSSRTELKMGRIWTSLGVPRFPKELARQVTRVMEARNAFVHYKWPSADEDSHTESIRRTEVEAYRAQKTVTELIELEDSVFYKGRSDAIKSAFRNGWHERRRETLAQ